MFSTVLLRRTFRGLPPACLACTLQLSSAATLLPGRLERRCQRDTFQLCYTLTEEIQKLHLVGTQQHGCRCCALWNVQDLTEENWGEGALCLLSRVFHSALSLLWPHASQY